MKTPDKTDPYQLKPGAEKYEGKYQLAIATSLAIEALFGINENIPRPDELPYTKYEYLYVNIATLFRNLHGSIIKELKAEWSSMHYVERFLVELQNLPLIVSDQSNNKLRVIYYVNTQKSIVKKFPNATLRNPKGTATLFYEGLETYALDHIKNNHPEIAIYYADTSIKFPEEGRIVMMTHLPLDLLDAWEIARVDLLESHTGVFKDRYKWYTKLQGGKDLGRVPFNKFTIQVFGDSKTFTPKPTKIRKFIADFAEKDKWNQSMSEWLVKRKLSKVSDQEIRALVDQL